MENKIDQMEKILKDRDMELLFARIASNLLNKGNVKEATKICEGGLKRFPMYAQGHYVLALCYDQAGKPKEARSEYERVLKYDPNHLKTLKNLTQIYQSEGIDDLYKEKTITSSRLNPFDTEIQQAARNLDQNEPAQPTPEEQLTRELESEESEENQNDPLNVPKVDLSQFDNQDDDFTTIIQGKSEEEKDQDQEEGDINLAVGTAAADLNTDTEANHRMEYEKEQRLSEDSGSKNEEKFEDLDELEFENDKPEKKEKHEAPEEWAMEVGENDATEIFVKKNNSDSGLKSQEKAEEIKGSVLETPDDDYQQPKIVTQTLGEILVSQKKYVQALKVFETLQDLHPENKNISKKVEFLKKIISLEQK